MSTYIQRIAPLNWKSLIKETLQRRKAEKMTQREHAALANVSIPTMATFESGETTLSLAKAFDILRVVGLMEELAEAGEQDIFLEGALERWNTLIDRLPQESSARFPRGYFRFDYYIEGDLKSIDLADFEKILRKVDTHPSRRVSFLLPLIQSIQPYETDGVLERWLKPEDCHGATSESDFWRVAPDGRMFLICGYQEDSVSPLSSRPFFDTTIPLVNMGEVLLHAERLSSLLQKNKDTVITIHFRALYTGLNGRVLHAWANPLSNVANEGRAALSDEVLLKAIIPAKDVSDRLAEHLYPLILSLYERFGVRELSKDFVSEEVQRLLIKEYR